MPAKRPKPALANPAAVHDGEADILSSVIANYADDTAKLVYADWLEERDDPRGPLLRAFVRAFRAGDPLPDTAGAPEPWCDLLGLPLMRHLHGSTLAARSDEFLALVRPAIGHTATAAGKRALPVGASKLGGKPDLPANVEWPEFEGLPLGFLGQFNFADLAPSPVARELPAAGLLSLFCLHDENRMVDEYPPGSYAVLYSPDATQLARREFPSALWREARIPTQALTFAESATLPDRRSPWVTGKMLVRGREEEVDFENFLDRALGNDHLLGHPNLLRNVAWKTVGRHLVTVGDIDGWVEDDVMYFTLSEAALEQRRFDRAKMFLRQF